MAGNATVHIRGGKVSRNVYGGGELASVGTFGPTTNGHDIIKGGLTTVTVTGGHIGADDNDHATSDSAYGNVYGAGLGYAGADTINNRIFHFSYYNYVKNSEVTIDSSAIVRGSVFGGAENGHVWNNTHVYIKGGEIGTELDSAEMAENAGGIGCNIYTGNVYGGGRGIDETDLVHHTHSMTAGRVFGNTYVEVTGGLIHHDVFGGGSLASVGDTVHDVTAGVAYDIMGNIIDGEYALDTTLDGTADSTRAYAEGDPVTGTGLAEVVIAGGRIGHSGHNEGSVFGSGRGLAGDNSHQEYYHMAFAHNTKVTIKDTTIVNDNNRYAVPDIRGAVFGGGANGHVTQNAFVKMSAGVVGGKDSSDYTPAQLATMTVDTIINGIKYYSGIAAADTLTDHWGRLTSGRPTFLGNIYGGGRGVDTASDGHLSRYAGRVFGNAKVEITGGVVYHSVYGGGSMASVGHYTAQGGYSIAHMKADKGTGLAVVKVTGGRIGNNGRNNGRIFGAGRGLPGSEYNFMSYVNITDVTVGGTAKVRGSVFGAGENGHVLDSTLVKIEGGTIGNGFRRGNDSWINEFIGNVYGGGRGVDLDKYNLPSPTAGWVKNSTHVIVSGGHIHHNVYGAGSIASVGRDTTVAYNDTYSLTNREGRSWVDITGGLIGIVNDPADSSKNHYGHVYGAGRGRAGVGIVNGNDWDKFTFVSNAVVNINYTTIDANNYITGNVYGGGNNGHVNNSTSVTITKGKIGTNGTRGYGSLEGNVFGGGNGEDTYEAYLVKDGYYVTNAGVRTNVAYNRTDRSGVRTYYQTTRSHDDSLAVVDSLSRGSGRTSGNTDVLINAANASDVQIMHHVYGGGSMATVGTFGKADAAYVAAHPDIDLGELYSNNPNTGNCRVTIIGGTIGTMGRNNGMVFGASRGDIGAPGSIYDTVAYVTNTFVTIGTSGQDTVFSNPCINGSVYGGGENGHTVGDAHVTIHSGRVGNHSDMYDSINDWYVIINSATATAAAKAAAQAKADSAADFLAFCGNVYGGGCGTDKYDTTGDGIGDAYNTFAGVVFGNATVEMDGGYVERFIYGGGSMANLGRRMGNATFHTNADSCFALSWPVDIKCRPGSGLATVNISGGARVGYNGKDNGDVFGASRGEAGDRYQMARIANVDSTSVTINIVDTATGYYDINPEVDHRTPMVAGALHGGAENGHVVRSTNIQITKGLVYHSVYGGGKGKGTYLVDLWKNGTAHTDAPDSLDVPIYSITAGRTYGNTHITMTGGKVGRNIYGGGNMASVGKGNYAGGPGDAYPDGYGEKWTSSNLYLIDTLANTGHTYITITGGTIGHLDPTKPSNSFKDDLPLGNVFGGCRGEAAPRSTNSPRFYYSPKYFSGYVNHTHIVIGASAKATPDASSPRLYGSVYGGGQDGHVRGETNVVINDAEIGVPYVSPADANTLVGIPTAADIAAGNTMIDNIHWVARGNVYGAGSGIGQYTDAQGVKHYNNASGSVTDSTDIIINGGLIHRNVYGGGSLSSVGAPVTRALSRDTTHTHVTVNGGQIGTTGDYALTYGGNVYGASRGEAGNSLDLFSTVFWSDVDVNGGTISGNVYGAGEIGQVKQDANVNITDGSVLASVYGGGKGASSNHEFARVKGNTAVNISGGKVDLCVYGGGEMASVGTIVNDTVADKHTDTLSSFFLSWPYKFVYADNTGNATVNITGGRIGITGKDMINGVNTDNGDVYGGSKGIVAERYAEAHYANVGTATVNIHYDTTVSASIYKDSVNAPCITGAVYGSGENGHVNGDTYIDISGGLIGHAVYGGGKGKDTYTATLRKHDNSADSIADIYSHTSGKVYGNTHITMTGGHVIRNIFGGGNLASVGKGNYACDSNDYNQYRYGYGERVDSYVGDFDTANSGHTYVTIANGTVGLYSTNPTKNYKDSIPYGSVFGGCRGIATFNDPRELAPRILYSPDDFLGYVNKTHVIIGTDTTSPTVLGSVYGGAQDGYVRWNTHVRILSGTIGVDYQDSTHALATMGTVDQDNIQWAGRGNVYGGGSGIGTWDNNGTPTFSQTSGSVTHFTTVDVEGGTIYRNVYGGGSLSTVGPPNIPTGKPDATIDSTLVQVNINGGTIGSLSAASVGYGGNVFGASRGDTLVDNTVFSTVDYTEVNISGGRAYASVYGGGEVGTVKHVAKVNITGGIIGDTTQYNNTTVFYNDTLEEGNAPDRIDVGHVFGAGKGYESTNAAFRNYYNVDTAMVTITNGRIYGSVFGGGANAHVTGNTIVNIDGGTIGTKGVSTWDGSVFGGGQGNSNSLTAGRVGGDATVTMTDGFLYGSIYGGGRMGLTGIDATGTYVAGKGNATVTVSGGTLGNPVADTLLASDYSVGDIFGSGRGDVDEYENVDAGRVANATVTVSGSTVIRGSVFGGGEMASVGYWDGTGTFEDGTGNTYVTIGGTPTIGTTAELTYNEADNPGQWTMYDDEGNIFHTCTGNVYGGSQGDIDTTSEAWVSMGRSNSATVVINGGSIMGCVFGGAEQGTMSGNTHVTINGGTIGSVVGNGSTAYIYGDVYAAGYGCDDPGECNSNAHNDSTDASVQMGIGWHPGLLAGRVFGNSQVDALGGHILGSVYGGGSFASVGDDKPGFPVNGNTTVNIGSAAQAGDPKKGVTIDGSVFGANNFDGTPFGNTTVNIYSTAHTTDDSLTVDNGATYVVSGDQYPVGLKAIEAPYDTLTIEDISSSKLNGMRKPLTKDSRYALQSVYGGGNMATHNPIAADGTTLVHVYYCEENTIRFLYGGGNAADTKNNHVILEGGHIKNVFGGGNGAGVGNPGANVHGTAITEVQGGIIDSVFGGSNARGYVDNIVLSIDNASGCDQLISNAFGGGDQAEGNGGEITLRCGVKFDNFYAGSNNADIGNRAAWDTGSRANIILNIEGGSFTNVFGANNAGGTVYGDVIVNYSGGNIKNLYGGGNAGGNVMGNIILNIDVDPDDTCADGLRLDYVYGGGKNAGYTPYDPFSASPRVNIMNNRYHSGTGHTAADSSFIEIQDVFGGGYGVTAEVIGYPRVVIGGFGDSTVHRNAGTPKDTTYTYSRGARIYGNVYGGGNAAPLNGNASVIVRDATIGPGNASDSTNHLYADRGIVFGGGYGATSTITGSTYVGIHGLSDIKNNVYGGGNAGAVTENTHIDVGYLHPVFPPEIVAYPEGGKIMAKFRVSGMDNNGTTCNYYYTTDGTRPDTNDLSDKYTTPFEITFGHPVRCIATKTGYMSSVMMTMTSLAPDINYNSTTGQVSLDATIGARIYYTTDGSTPDPAKVGDTEHPTYLYGTVGEVDGTPFPVTSTTTIKAMTQMRGCIDSPVVTYTVTIP